MAVAADLALYDRKGQLVAIVEIKNRRHTSSQWATQLRHNMLAHEEYAKTDYFLLVTPDRLYIWQNADPTPTLLPPTYDLDAQPLLAPYFARIRADSETISSPAFELLVSTWLSELMLLGGPPETCTQSQEWLITSGFREALRDGRIAYEETL